MPHRIAARFVTRWRGTAFAVLAPLAAVAVVAVINARTADSIRQGQVEACLRGNVIRLQMAEDNAIAIQVNRTQLAHPEELGPSELESLHAAIRRRIDRAADLAPYQCESLR